MGILLKGFTGHLTGIWLITGGEFPILGDLLGYPIPDRRRGIYLGEFREIPRGIDTAVRRNRRLRDLPPPISLVGRLLLGPRWACAL